MQFWEVEEMEGKEKRNMKRQEKRGLLNSTQSKGIDHMAAVWRIGEGKKKKRKEHEEDEKKRRKTRSK